MNWLTPDVPHWLVASRSLWDEALSGPPESTASQKKHSSRGDRGVQPLNPLAKCIVGKRHVPARSAEWMGIVQACKVHKKATDALDDAKTKAKAADEVLNADVISSLKADCNLVQQAMGLTSSKEHRANIQAAGPSRSKFSWQAIRKIVFFDIGSVHSNRAQIAKYSAASKRTIKRILLRVVNVCRAVRDSAWAGAVKEKCMIWKPSATTTSRNLDILAHALPMELADVVTGNHLVNPVDNAWHEQKQRAADNIFIFHSEKKHLWRSRHCFCDARTTTGSFEAAST